MPNPAGVSDLTFMMSKGSVVGGENRLSIENLNVPVRNCSAEAEANTGVTVTVWVEIAPLQVID